MTLTLVSKVKADTFSDSNNDTLGTDTKGKGLIPKENPDKEIDFDFTLQKSMIKKKISTVGDLIHINFDKNKRNAVTANNKSISNTSAEKKIVIPVVDSLVNKINYSNNNNPNNNLNIIHEKNKNVLYDVESGKKNSEENKKEMDKQLEKNPGYFSALFDKSKTLNIKSGFLNEFFTSFSLNFFSEIGDKSFIAVFLFTNQASWVTLFIVASVTEVLFNSISVVIGYNLRAYQLVYFMLIYITIFTTLLFGFLLMKEAIYEEQEGEEEKQQEQVENLNTDFEKSLHQKKGKLEDKKSFSLLIFKIFWVVLLSELGDKSQIVTIILSTHHNPLPIFLGTAIAHVFGVLLSILLGSLVTSRISKKIMNYIAATCFISYGLFVSVSYFFDKKSIL